MSGIDIRRFMNNFTTANNAVVKKPAPPTPNTAQFEQAAMQAQVKTSANIPKTPQNLQMNTSFANQDREYPLNHT